MEFLGRHKRPKSNREPDARLLHNHLVFIVLRQAQLTPLRAHQLARREFDYASTSKIRVCTSFGFLKALPLAVPLTRPHFASVFLTETRILRVLRLIQFALRLRQTSFAHNDICLARAKL